jgi:glycosyltransferase involved in cell wall biosynthesis
MISGATETAYIYLEQYYKFPKNVEVSHNPKILKSSTKEYKILWAHHAYDQGLYYNFDHAIADHIVFPSQWAQKNFIKIHKVPIEKTTVIYNGVSDIFKYSANKTKTFIHTSIPYKGLVLFPEIIKRIHKLHPDAKFKIFSSMSLYGDANDPYNELYESLKSLPNVEYSEAVDQNDLVKHYQESAFFIHPNIWEETFCVSMAEAMKSGCYPIITNIGAIPEIATEDLSSIVPIDGKRTNIGFEVTDDFINKFTESCISAINLFEKSRSEYDQLSQKISSHISDNCDWEKISIKWKNLISKITGEIMSEQNQYSTLAYTPINAEQAVNDNDYLLKAYENVLLWEESDKELAQGRTNFQIEKFILLEQHTIPAAFENILKTRRQMAEGYMFKLIEMKQKVREFQWKWGNVEDKTKPLLWNNGADTKEYGGRLCYYDLEELSMTHYLKSSELEIRDRLYQLEHLDKILEKLVEMNGGKPVTRQQYLEGDALYWERRFADQAMDEMLSQQTGISIGNLHSMRRASAPALIDQKNQLETGYLPLDKILSSPEGRMDFIKDLQRKVLDGIEEVTDSASSRLSGSKEDQKLLEQQRKLIKEIEDMKPLQTPDFDVSSKFDTKNAEFSPFNSEQSRTEW